MIIDHQKRITNSGFTLLELLVVISIIGLLASVILVSVNTARVKARDTQRLSDMQQIYTALYSFYNDYGCLPMTSASTCGGVSAFADSGSWDYSSQGTAGSLFLPFLRTKGYLSTVPLDPINNKTGDGAGAGLYAYRYYCYPVGVGSGLHLGFHSEISNGLTEVIYSGIKAGNPVLFADPQFTCR